METDHEGSAHGRWAVARDRAGLIVAWGIWAAMTAGLFLYVAHYSRNMPYMDDFEMVPVVTGTQAVSFDWAWAQHNEHRPVISRLILVGLFRYVQGDFRLPRYVNAGLLSLMAACMLLLARHLRGSARLTDAVLPLSILNAAQTESLLIGFAMNLILSSFLAIALILTVAQGRRWMGRVLAMSFGLSLVLLPLNGGSGLTMVPPLALWLAGYVTCGWWSGWKPDGATRAIGLGLLCAGSAIAVFYFYGYHRPPWHPLPRSLGSVVSSTLLYLSLAVYPQLSAPWWPASAIGAILVTATLVLLAIRAFRTPAERPRALGLMAIILSMLCVAGAVGISRSGLGPAVILASRYITLTFPLLVVLYIAWLLYGGARVRVGVHLILLVLIGATVSDSQRYSRRYGRPVLAAEQRVESGLRGHVPTPVLMSAACPDLYPMPERAGEFFKMMEAARLGPFAGPGDDRVARATDSGGSVRR